MNFILQALDFAASRHRDQRRKDYGASPYINHVIQVAAVLARDGGVTDPDVLVAAVLHDTVEDTETTLSELETEFGPRVAAMVAEVTDDKTLPKAVRKQQQIRNARGCSPGAQMIRIADKICNVRDVTSSPPAHWALERRREYLDWTEQVVAGCRGCNPALEGLYDAVLAAGRAALA